MNTRCLQALTAGRIGSSESAGKHEWSSWLTRRQLGEQDAWMTENKPTFPGYQVLRELAAGGMGSVYKCCRETDNRVVAVKVPKEPLSRIPVFVEAFRNEALRAKAIKHKNIADVIEVSGGDAPCIIMEYVKGCSLASLIAERGRLSQERSLRIALRTLQALEAAHAAGIVHRDVKPSNILLDERGAPKLVDFGIAGALESIDAEVLAETGAFAGTAEYMSPEQCRGAQIDPRCDLYSLGIVLYEMLAGTVPFTGPHSTVILSQVQDQPKKLSSLIDGVSQEVEEIVMKALQKQPEDRFQTAAEMAESIREVLGEDASADESTAEPVSVGEGGGDLAEEDSRPTKLWKDPLED